MATERILPFTSNNTIRHRIETIKKRAPVCFANFGRHASRKVRTNEQNAKVNVEAARTLLGHSSSSITKAHYIEVDYSAVMLAFDYVY